MRRRRLPKAKICPHCKTPMLRYADRCVECGWTPWLKEENTRYLLIAGILTLCAMLYLVFGLNGSPQMTATSSSHSSEPAQAPATSRGESRDITR